MSKIIDIGSASSGMSHLFDQSAKHKTAPKIGVPKQEEDSQCMLMHVPLQNKSYFMPVDALGIVPPTQQMPVVIFSASVAYSEIQAPLTQDDIITGGCFAKKPPISIQKHTQLQITATGIVTEIVNVPSWWSKRDEGGF